jgi:hypothetical protein
LRLPRIAQRASDFGKPLPWFDHIRLGYRNRAFRDNMEYGGWRSQAGAPIAAQELKKVDRT